jgi:tetratricopeptide (TPR) repeat protein
VAKRPWSASLAWAVEGATSWRRQLAASAVSRWCLQDARARNNPAQERRALHVFVALSLHSESAERIHEALLECLRSNADSTVSDQLLRAALEARIHGRFEAAAALLEPIRDVPDALRSAFLLVRTWTLRSKPDQLLAFLLDDAIWGTSNRLAGLRSRWLALAHNRTGDFQAAVSVAEQQMSNVPPTPADLCNHASALLETGARRAAIRIADQALREVQKGASPLWVAQATWLARHARYRARAEQLPRPDLVDAAIKHELSNTGVLALNEAAIAWRCQKPELAGRLARGASVAFSNGGSPAGKTLALVLAGVADGDLITLRDLAPAVDSLAPGDIKVQATGLLFLAGLRDAAAVASHVIRPKDQWFWRLDVLSTEEALAGRLERTSTGTSFGSP